MTTVDRCAYANHIRHLDPAIKAGIVSLVIIQCLLLNSPLVGWLATGWMLALAFFWARLPIRTVSRLLLVETAFLGMAAAGTLFSISWSTTTPTIVIMPGYLGHFTQLVGRALGCTSAMNFLALTTPLTDLIDLGRRLRIPVLLIEVSSLIYRNIFIFLEQLEKIHIAQESRLGYCNMRQSFVSTATLIAQLFGRSFQRSHRLQIAAESRGWENEIRFLPTNYQISRLPFGLVLLISTSLTLAAWV